mmetsp:Transcript_25789/g.67591  ORF Transcript_25789/g.67591 Transcript_25789/m.67591 type:complete len:556 (-) Transcript_25789:9-1676(-)
MSGISSVIEADGASVQVYGRSDDSDDADGQVLEAADRPSTSLERRLQAINEELRTENLQLIAELEGLQNQGSLLEQMLRSLLPKRMKALTYAPKDLLIVYYIKFTDSVAYFAIAYIYVQYLSDEFGLSDSEAGVLYAFYGGLCTIVGLLMGHVIDVFGVRRSCLIGCIGNFVSRGCYGLFSSGRVAWFTACTLSPLGAAFGVPVLALGVRRYSHLENREFAFSWFYVMLCASVVAATLMINRIRSHYPDGADFAGVHLSWMRMVVLLSTLLTASTVVAASFLRDIQVLSDRPLSERAFCVFEPRTEGFVSAAREVWRNKRFWRLAAITFVFCGVRMTFRHMDATFPKYFVRTFGPEAPFELILSIEPVITTLITPLATWLLQKYKVTFANSLLIGAFVSGISIFALSIWESFAGAVIFVVVLSIGEVIWSPKLYEFSTMCAPEGREGIYVAITLAPLYVSSMPVGIISGWALEKWCPKGATAEMRHTQLMWFVIGLGCFSSPVLLCLLRNVLLKDEDEPESTAEVGREHPHGMSHLGHCETDCETQLAVITNGGA